MPDSRHDIPTMSSLYEAEHCEAMEPVHGEHLRQGLVARAGVVTERDVDRLLSRGQRFARKLREVPGRFRKLISQARLLWDMLRDYRSGVYTNLPWRSVALAAAVLLYFLNPVDLIPDILPFGFLDDFAVMAFALRALRKDLLNYCAFKGRDPARYF